MGKAGAVVGVLGRENDAHCLGCVVHQGLGEGEGLEGGGGGRDRE
jgi:hypothetical protein